MAVGRAVSACLSVASGTCDSLPATHPCPALQRDAPPQQACRVQAAVSDLPCIQGWAQQRATAMRCKANMRSWHLLCTALTSSHAPCLLPMLAPLRSNYRCTGFASHSFCLKGEVMVSWRLLCSFQAAAVQALQVQPNERLVRACWRAHLDGMLTSICALPPTAPLCRSAPPAPSAWTGPPASATGAARSAWRRAGSSGRLSGTTKQPAQVPIPGLNTPGPYLASHQDAMLLHSGAFIRTT